MEPKYFSDAYITITCEGFRNPIYNGEWGGFYVTTFDGEPSSLQIETSDEIKFVKEDMEPRVIPNNNLVVQPQSFVVGKFSIWTIFLESPLPMEKECYIKFYLPTDLVFSPESVKGTGLFQPSEDLTEIDADQAPYNPDDTPSPSILFKGCMNENELLGQKPSCSLIVDRISTPIMIKDSEAFIVEIYKD